MLNQLPPKPMFDKSKSYCESCRNFVPGDEDTPDECNAEPAPTTADTETDHNNVVTFCRLFNERKISPVTFD